MDHSVARTLPDRFRLAVAPEAVDPTANRPSDEPLAPRQSIRVLFLSQDKKTIGLVRGALGGEGPTFRLKTCSQPMPSREELNIAADVILLDLAGPNALGLAAFHEARNHAPEVPIVVLVDFGGERLAAEVMSGGAQDFLCREQMTGPLLTHCLQHAVERHLLQQALACLSYDPLTGLYCRRSFLLLGEQYLRLARRMQGLSLVYLNVAGLRQINQSFGHGAGNRVLIRLGRVLQTAFRKSDLVGRLGGDRFAAMVMGPQPRGAVDSFERFHHLLWEFGRSRGLPGKLNVQVGSVFVAPESTQTITALLAAAADAAVRTCPEE